MWLALALVLGFALLVWRLEVLVRAFLPDILAHRERVQTANTSTPQREPLPPDLEAIATAETEPWAQEQVRAAILDEYEQRRDWDAVRNAYYGTDA